MRKKRPLDRSTNVVRDANLIVIASEDTYAVRQYFDFFRSTRIQFKVLETKKGKSAPEHVLAKIDEYMKEYEIGPGDEFWLVCDCDHWIDAGTFVIAFPDWRPTSKRTSTAASSKRLLDPR